MAEDAPNAGAEDIHPAPTEASADAATPPASAEKSSSETLLPSLSIWPPSQRTRDAVVRRVVQTLSAPSVLSQRYGAIPEPEAEVAAAAVEAEAFAAASGSAAASPASLEDGIEVLQAYSKEVSRRLLELAKSRAAAAAAAAPETPAEPSAEESEASSVTAPPPTEE
ncbi:hypothetical protein ACQJBY_008912 [Aegilops geniculata]